MVLKDKRFYFIRDEYYEKFPDCNLMGNKEGHHNRPCYYCYDYDRFFMMVPISSQLEKYQAIYDEKIKKYSSYDGIVFGFVNGKKRAFLIQNLCPVTEEFISEVYTIEKGTVEVTIDDKLSEEIGKKVRKVMAMYKKGIKITLTDIKKIIDALSQ